VTTIYVDTPIYPIAVPVTRPMSFSLTPSSKVYTEALKDIPILEDNNMPLLDPEIILFRGDREFIHRFKYERTDPSATYGRGIYLTEDQGVADTYRTKSSKFGFRLPQHTISKHEDAKTIFSGEAANQEEAIAKAFTNFYRRVDPYGNLLIKPWRKRITRKHHIVILEKWASIQSDLHIQGRVYPSVTRSIISRSVNGSFNKYYSSFFDYPAEVIVQCRSMPYIGAVTIFKFPRQELFDRTIPINSIWDIDKAYMKQMVVIPVGVRYMGGRIMGTHDHQCFVIFDEDYANHHRIRSIK
jgi:hypothetical protein